MQVIAPDLFAPFGGPASARSEERPGDGLFDTLLREEDARYREDPQPRRDLPEASRPPREHSDAYDDPREEPVRETREEAPREPTERRDAESVEDTAPERTAEQDRPAAPTKIDQEATRSDPASHDSVPSNGSEPAGKASAAAVEKPAGTPATNAAVSADKTAGVASGAIAATTTVPGQAADAGKATGTPAAAANSGNATAAANAHAQQSPASAQPAGAAAAQERSAAKDAAASANKAATPVAAAARPATAEATGPRPDKSAARGTASGPAASLRQTIVVESGDGLNSRPTAALGGGAATAALAQKADSAGTTSQGGTPYQAEGLLDGKTNNAAATSGQNGKTADLVVATLGKSTQPQTMASGGNASGGDTAGNGTPFGSNSTLPAGGAIGGTAAQSTSFAETLANARPAPTANPAEQIALQVRRAQVAGQEQINIKLHPAELGRIEVRLESANDGTLRAVISAERSETLDLLQRDARGLERALQDAGVKTDSGTLNFNLRGQNHNQGQLAQDQGAAGQGGRGTSGGQGQEADSAAPPQHYRTSHDGTLDIEV